MGAGSSQQADAQHQSEVSQNHENHHNTKTAGITTSTRLNNLPHACETILKDADSPTDTSSTDQLYAGVFLNKKRKVSNCNCFYLFILFFS